jgi:hypothetical protein
MTTYRITKTILSGVCEGIQVVDTHQASDCNLIEGKKYDGVNFKYRVDLIEVVA